MKQILSLTVILLIIISFSCVKSYSMLKSSKSTKAAKFVAHFLRQYGNGKSIKSLTKRIKKECPKLRRSYMMSNIRSRLYKMKKGLRKLNNLKNGASRRTIRRINRIKKINVLRLVKAIYKRISKCRVTPRKIAKKLKYIVSKINKINRRKCKGSACRLLNFNKVIRVTNGLAHFAGINRTTHRRKKKYSYLKKKSKLNKKTLKDKKVSKFDFPRKKIIKLNRFQKAQLKRIAFSKKLHSLKRRRNFMRGMARMLVKFAKSFEKYKN